MPVGCTAIKSLARFCLRISSMPNVEIVEFMQNTLVLQSLLKVYMGAHKDLMPVVLGAMCHVKYGSARALIGKLKLETRNFVQANQPCFARKLEHEYP